MDAPPRAVPAASYSAVPPSSPQPPTALVWMRMSDLRTLDHEPLLRASEWAAKRPGGRVLPVWCFDPRLLTTSPFGFARLGVHRARFLLESIADLRARLVALGGTLVVRTGRPEEVLPLLAHEAGATQCFYHEEACTEELSVERSVRRVLTSAHVACSAFWGHTLVNPKALGYDITELPELFTTFRTKLEQPGNAFKEACAPHRPLPPPARINSAGVEPGKIPTLAELGLTPRAPDARSLMVIEGGETAGLARLHTWVATRLSSYKTTRNGMLNPDDSSKLSHWLAHGCLSARTVYDAITRHEAAHGKTEETYWLVFELLWRDYFRLIALKHGARLFRLSGLADLLVPWLDPRTSPEAADLFAKWREGRTGYPLVDASMRELAVTGYTSNRARQNVASFLTKNLGIDWRAGAEYFEEQLIDYDPASNWGNWAYAAGVGNDARGFRFFNIYKQAADYDPNGDFARHWLPELARVPGGAIHTPHKISPADQVRYGVRVGADYPYPVVDLHASAAKHEVEWARAYGTAPAGSGGPRHAPAPRIRPGGPQAPRTPAQRGAKAQSKPQRVLRM